MGEPTYAPGLIGLRDIVLPEPIAYTPATPAWLFLALLLLFVLMWCGWRRLRAWQADAYRRDALEELAILERALADDEVRPDALAALAPLVKRTALSFESRDRVAGLYGDAWLRFLDEVGPAPQFLDGPGRFLEQIAFWPPSRRAAISEEEARALFGAVDAWVRAHRRPEDETGFA